MSRSAIQPPTYKASQVYALQALAKGEANAHQQKQALDWIIDQASNRWDQPYFGDDEGGSTATAFACGRMFVGQQIIKLVNMSNDIVAKLAAKEGNPNG